MLSVLRIVAALLFFEHGTQKLFDLPPAKVAMVFDIASRNGVAGVLETFGGFALLIGLFTRPIAFLLAGEMAVAYFTVHFPRSFYPILNGGDNVVLFCFVFLYLVFAGAGVWSVDAVLDASRRKRRSRGLA
jgi:putative oxidoreductase